jgi:hypothetical protein
LTGPETEPQTGCGEDSQKLPQASDQEQFRMFGTTFAGTQIIESPASDNAKQVIARSFKVTLALSLAVLGLLFADGANIAGLLVLTALSAYIAWASYWGIAGVFKLIEGRPIAVKIGEYFEAHPTLKEKTAEQLADKLGIVGIIAFPICIGIVYGVLGGCVYEFLRCRRIARNPELPAEAE